MYKNKKHNWKLYGLKLENGKYYVGITSKTVEERYSEHLGKRGAQWTRENPPMQIIHQENLGIVSEDEAKSKENLLVREYLQKYGENNVRGGDIYWSENLVKRFGWYWEEYYWESLVAVATLAIIIIAMAAYIIIKKI